MKFRGEVVIFEIIELGKYNFRIGNSSRDIKAEVSVSIN